MGDRDAGGEDDGGGRGNAGCADLARRLEALGFDAGVVGRAAEHGELAQLAVERVLADERRFTAGEIAERSGLEAEEFVAHMTALGRPRPGLDERAFGDEDLEAARRIAAFAALGLPRERLLEQARVFRPALGHVAEAVLELVAETALLQTQDETEFAVALAELAEGLAPFAEPLLGYVLRLQLRQGLRDLVVQEAELAAGRLPDTRTVTVCFADLTGFTEFGERATPGELSSLTERFGELAVAAAGAEVRLVKMLGDAAMFVAPDTDAVLGAALTLVETAAAEGAGFPAVHAGVARGSAVARAGDWYGAPVNRASRLTGVARPGQVVADSATRAAASRWRWSELGERPLKGVGEPVAVHLAHPPVKKPAADLEL